MDNTDTKVFWRGELKRALQSKGCKYGVVQAILSQYDKATLTQAPDYAFNMALYDIYRDDEMDVVFAEAKASLTSILEDEIRKQLGGRKLSGAKKRKWNVDKLQYDTGKRDEAKNLEKVWSRQEIDKALNARLQQTCASVSAKARSLEIEVLL